MLPLACMQYPLESDYTDYLTQNSGSSNAFTGMDQTNYQYVRSLPTPCSSRSSADRCATPTPPALSFDVHPSGLDGALDRFSQFFIAPVFDPSCTEREANAVDSENSKNLQVDMWRMYQLDKTLSSREHSYWRFGTGNKKTLWDEPRAKGVDVRARLIEWQAQNYSANLMKLCVLSNGKSGRRRPCCWINTPG